MANGHLLRTAAGSLYCQTDCGHLATDFWFKPRYAPAGTVGVPYSFTFSGQHSYWSIVPGNVAPPGLSLVNIGYYPYGGKLSGTPTTAGTWRLNVLDLSGHCLRRYIITIGAAAPSNITITTVALPNVVYGASYTVQMAATGGTTPYTWTVASGAFPAGISMSSSGLIYGSSTAAAGSYTVTLRCADTSSQSTTKQFNFSMLANPSANVCIELTQYISSNTLYFFVLDPAGYEYFPLWSWDYDPWYYRNTAYFAPVLGTNSDYNNGVTPNGGYTYSSPLLTSPDRFVDQVAWTNGNSPSGIYKFYFFNAGGYDSSYFRFRIYTNGSLTPFWERYTTIGDEERAPYHPCSRLYTYNSATGVVSSN